MLPQVIIVLQIVLAILLMVVILVQAKGTGLGSAWGGSGESYRSKRGVEKILFNATLVIALLFLLTSVVNILMR